MSVGKVNVGQDVGFHYRCIAVALLKLGDS